MKRTRFAPVVLASSMFAFGGWALAQQSGQPATPPAGSSQGAQPSQPAGQSAQKPSAQGPSGSAMPSKPADRPADARSTAAPGGMSGPDRAEWDRRHRASKIIGSDVRNAQGEKIGDIEDLVIDDQGATQVAIVSTGGFLGIGDSLHAIPWAELKMAAGEKNRGDRILNMSKEDLKEIPGFSSKDWPNFADPEWVSKNRGLYTR